MLIFIWLLAAAVQADLLSQMRDLYTAAAAQNRELVACLAADSIGPPLDSAGDSLSASAEAALELCQPPRWEGVVHTHQHPSRFWKHRLSPADRAVISEWRWRWRVASRFCVVWGPRRGDIYCERWPRLEEDDNGRG